MWNKSNQQMFELKNGIIKTIVLIYKCMKERRCVLERRMRQADVERRVKTETENQSEKTIKMFFTLIKEDCR